LDLSGMTGFKVVDEHVPTDGHLPTIVESEPNENESIIKPVTNDNLKQHDKVCPPLEYLDREIVQQWLVKVYGSDCDKIRKVVRPYKESDLNVGDLVVLKGGAHGVYHVHVDVMTPDTKYREKSVLEKSEMVYFHPTRSGITVPKKIWEDSSILKRLDMGPLLIQQRIKDLLDALKDAKMKNKANVQTDKIFTGTDLEEWGNTKWKYLMGKSLYDLKVEEKLLTLLLEINTRRTKLHGWPDRNEEWYDESIVLSDKAEEKLVEERDKLDTILEIQKSVQTVHPRIPINFLKKEPSPIGNS